MDFNQSATLQVIHLDGNWQFSNRNRGDNSVVSVYKRIVEVDCRSSKSLQMVDSSYSAKRALSFLNMLICPILKAMFFVESSMKVNTPAELIIQMQGCGSLPVREHCSASQRIFHQSDSSGLPGIKSLRPGLKLFYLLTK